MDEVKAKNNKAAEEKEARKRQKAEILDQALSKFTEQIKTFL